MDIFFWDIDGTLIRTDKAGLYAFEQAVRELWDSPVDFRQIHSAGMTDYSIARQTTFSNLYSNAGFRQPRIFL